MVYTCDDLPQPLTYLQSVIVGDTLYILGGSDDDDKASKAVYAASLGALSSHQLKWQQLPNTPCASLPAVSLISRLL